MGPSSVGVLDGLNNVFIDYVWVLFSIDSNKLQLVLVVDELSEGAVLKQLLLDVWMLILWLVNQAIQNVIIKNSFLEDIVIFVSNRIKSSLLQFLVDQVVLHLKGDEEVWLLVKLLQHADLVV